MKSRNQSGSAHVVIIIVLVVVVLGLLGYVFWSNFIQKPAVSSQTTSTSQPTATSSTDTKKFTSQQYGISFDYPSDWTVNEEVNTAENTATYYNDTITISNDQGDEVALLNTGGQIGGSCDPATPTQDVSTLVDDAITVPGISTTTHFGYTVVTKNDGTFGVAYGLDNGKATLAKGDSALACPSMSVNYNYFINLEDSPLTDITFGVWYGESSVDNVGIVSFDTLAEAKAYASSPAFQQIETMIKSLTIAS